MIVWDVYSTKTFILNKEIHHPLLYFKQNTLIMGGLNIIYIEIMVLGCAGMSFKSFILMKYFHLKSLWSWINRIKNI